MFYITSSSTTSTISTTTICYVNSNTVSTTACKKRKKRFIDSLFEETDLVEVNPTVPEMERDIEAEDALLDSSFDTKNFDSEERRLRKEIYLILIFCILIRYMGKTIET